MEKNVGKERKGCREGEGTKKTGRGGRKRVFTGDNLSVFLSFADPPKPPPSLLPKIPDD